MPKKLCFSRNSGTGVEQLDDQILPINMPSSRLPDRCQGRDKS